MLKALHQPHGNGNNSAGILRYSPSSQVSYVSGIIAAPHYLLMSISVFFLLSHLCPASLDHILDELLAVLASSAFLSLPFYGSI